MLESVKEFELIWSIKDELKKVDVEIRDFNIY